MKILHLTVDYPPPLRGGLPRQVHGLAHTLAMEHTVGIVTTGSDRIDGPIQIFGGDPVYGRLPSRELPPLIKANLGLCRGLIKAAAADSWDLVHAHDWMVAPSAVMARDGLGMPVVASLHADSGAELVGSPEDRLRRLEWEQSLVGASSVLLTCGEGLRRAVQARYPDRDVRYVPNGLWTKQFSDPLDGVHRRSMQLLFVGRLVPYKGCQDVLAAVKLLRPAWPNIELQIVGDGFFRKQLEELVTDLGLEDCVTFAGWLNGTDLVRAYRQAAIVVAPSHEEAFGLVPLEAIASGAAVVATTIGAFAAIIEDGTTGLLVVPGSPEQLARQIDRLLRNPQWRDLMAATARKQIPPRFDWKRVVTHSVTIYEEIVGRGSLD